ncbi:hypothetical protein [Longimicrobium sp.]|uniref:hypothetical protein n=1 Tax=Longimicrobium sp. TaxID=2029185 RepID=UPI002E367202|nr:hypothetical protein [Longimicrobium sp.]HEX6037987.1 hypothetical protein [Longimicrobium sp.]
MTGEYALVLALRLLHVAGGVMWVGAAVLMAGFVVPAARDADADGFLPALMRDRRAGIYMVATAATTILSGIALYARMSALTQGAFAATHQGMVLGAGGAAGVLALLTGALGTGPAARRMAMIGGQARGERRAPTPDEARQMGRLQARVRWCTALAMTLLLVATGCMAVARYV